MPTERAMKAAKAICRSSKWEFVGTALDGLDELVAESEIADLIDRAAGLPELEARVAELERRWNSVRIDSSELSPQAARWEQRAQSIVDVMEERDDAKRRLGLVCEERDALEKRIADVIDYLEKRPWPCELSTRTLMRLALGEEE